MKLPATRNLPDTLPILLSAGRRTVGLATWAPVGSIEISMPSGRGLQVDRAYYLDKLPKTLYLFVVAFCWTILKGFVKSQRRAAKALVTVPIDFSVVLPWAEATTSVSPSRF